MQRQNAASWKGTPQWTCVLLTAHCNYPPASAFESRRTALRSLPFPNRSSIFIANGTITSTERQLLKVAKTWQVQDADARFLSGSCLIGNCATDSASDVTVYEDGRPHFSSFARVASGRVGSGVTRSCVRCDLHPLIQGIHSPNRTPAIQTTSASC